MMNLKRLLSVLAAALVGLFAVGCMVGCDEHPRSGQVDNERVAESPEEVHENQPSQAGAVGSELTAHTEGVMEQCIEVVNKVRDCTAKQPFTEALVKTRNITAEELEVLVNFWREPGGVRQSCQQIFQAEDNNPFRAIKTLEAMVEATEQPCLDLAGVLGEVGAIDVLSDVDI